MEDPGSQTILLQLLLLLVLTLFNAFFSASEMALVSLNRSRVEQKAEEGDKRYKRLVKVLDNPNNFLSTVQVGNTFVNVFAGAKLADHIGATIGVWLGNNATAQTAGSLIALIFLTYISIVLGELYPKRIAMNLKDRFAIYSAPVILFMEKVVSIFVWLLSASTNLLSHLTPMNFDDADDQMTRDEIEYMLTKNDSDLDAEEIDMLQGVLTLDEMMAREVMVPRTDAFMVDINDETQDIIQSILKQNFSRIPVYDDDKDKIIGLIHIKALLKAAYQEGFDGLNIRRVMQEVLFVPDTIFVDDLIGQMQSNQQQLAILLDEYGGVAGLVTLEDLLEEIVGEIEDETDKAAKEVHEIGEQTYIVQGTMTINDFNDHFDTELESDDVDTMAGFYLAGIGTIPSQEVKESYQVTDKDKLLTFTNDKVKNGRVTKLKLEIQNQTQDNQED